MGHPRAALAALAIAALLASCGAPPPPPSLPDAVPTAGPTTPAPPTTPPPTATPPPSATSPARVVGLGDSVMAGTNCDCPGPLAAYADAVERTRGVRPTVQNLGVPGWTTGDVTALLARDATARQAVADADTVVVIVGANDLFRMGVGPTTDPDPSALPGRLSTLRERLDATLDAVRSADDGAPPTYLVAGYWDILAEPDAETTWSGVATAAVNATIADAARSAGMEYVDVASAFAAAGGSDGVRSMISDDDLHPNARGVRVIGEALAAATG